MDPEQRLWFLEQTVLYFLSAAHVRDSLSFENAFDTARFIDLEITDSGVAMELGLCEHTCRRPKPSRLGLARGAQVAS
jgi:hypothetical protein